MKDATADTTQDLPLFLPAILDGLSDGVLLLSATGTVLHANAPARLICQFGPTLPSSASLPLAIAHFCQTLCRDRPTPVDPSHTIEVQVQVSHRPCPIRLRARWLPDLPSAETPVLLVMLEDCAQSKAQRAIADGRLWGLTARETEVWRLFCAQQSYREIAQHLFISVDTVKKHLKNIRQKQRQTETPRAAS